MPPLSLIDPQLLKCAKHTAFGLGNYVPGSDLMKSAVVPPGGGGPMPGPMPPGGDPTGAGAPGGPPPGAPPAPPAAPADPLAGPPAGGAADPAMIQQIVQQTMQAMGGGAGGAPGAGGMKPPTKKVDPAILDTKMWQIMKMLALLLEHNQISIPADLALGPPPDPMQMQAAMQDQQTAMSGGAPAGAPAPSDPSMAPPPGGDPMAAAGGAPPAGGSSMAPVEPMQPAMPQDPMAAGGKQASLNIGSEYSAPQVRNPQSDMVRLASLARNLIRHAS